MFSRSLLSSIVLSSLMAFAQQAGAQTTIRAEAEALNAAMVSAFKADPASVARFYTDDASILGGGQRHVGREAIDRYWREATMFADWKLEVLEAGGSGTSAWQRGRSTLVGKSGRTMVTEFIGILKRGDDGKLRFYVDMFVAAPGASASVGIGHAITTCRAVRIARARPPSATHC